ncbi:hypothetical protein BDN72DRAFT_906057 [Pluteus cervinus]|uniref:Uncharacterized protein n=1 Tax=Pluteus cervinus TaxID=181527 RepID=A0ACD3A0Q5_9AGAR|nr:hypothetical protein BDN72DRAFT_906057 [Pluteus cervinus]
MSSIRSTTGHKENLCTIRIDPFLYRTVVYSGGRTTPRLIPQGHVLPPDSPPTFGHHVRNLMIHHIPASKALRYLSSCSSITNLFAHHHPGFNWSLAGPILQNLSLSRFSGDPSFTFGSLDFPKHPAFSGLTHLHHTGFNLSRTDFRSIMELPSLTHLSVSAVASEDAVKGALEGSRRLEVLVIQLVPSAGVLSRLLQSSWEQSITDPRLACVCVDDMEEDWISGATGGPNFWSVADEIVASRMVSLANIRNKKLATS